MNEDAVATAATAQDNQIILTKSTKMQIQRNQTVYVLLLVFHVIEWCSV